jgi:hypothetical protein
MPWSYDCSKDKTAGANYGQDRDLTFKAPSIVVVVFGMVEEDRLYKYRPRQIMMLLGRPHPADHSIIRKKHSQFTKYS